VQYNPVGDHSIVLTSVTDYLGFQYKDGVLQFFPTSEGYVSHTKGSYSYVYNYTDHLGNVRMSYAKNPASPSELKIIEENHYYPFGLKHQNYNSEEFLFDKKDSNLQLRAPVGGQILPYQYKYQGQERQDELGLNWDSFKYRNYDYAIGRFMNLDPLAEDYSYQSPYNFAENRVVDGRELEGLEWKSSTSSDGKTVNLNLNVRTVNNSGGVITNEQMSALASERAAALGSSMGGTDSQGRNVNVSVSYSDKATMVWEYNMEIDTSKTASADKGVASIAAGWTDEIGNTQVNRTQINLTLPFADAWDSKGNLKIDDPQTRAIIANTGIHEDGHTVGGRHEDDPKVSPELQTIQNANPNSLMNNGAPGSTVSAQQRTEIIKRVENQQGQ